MAIYACDKCQLNIVGPDGIECCDCGALYHVGHSDPTGGCELCDSTTFRFVDMREYPDRRHHKPVPAAT